jgi:hypothetical protein
MAKETWSVRIEIELKNKIKSFVESRAFSNEDIVKAGYESLIENGTVQNTTEKIIDNIELAHFFSAEEFNIDNFEQILVGLPFEAYRYKLSTSAFWIEYRTLLIMNNTKKLYVTDVDHKLDLITVGVVGEENSLTIPIQTIINDLSVIKKIYRLKV